MRDLDLRKQLKSFGKGLIKGAAASITGVASLGANVAKNFAQPKVGNLPSITEAGSNQEPPKKPSTGMRATSRKLKRAKAISKKMQKSKKLEKLPATSTSAKQAEIKTVKTKSPSPKISKAKPTVKKTNSNKKVKTKVKTNKRGVVKIKTKIK